MSDKPYVDITSTELMELFLVVQNSRNLSRALEFGALTLEQIKEEGLQYIGNLETSNSSSSQKSPEAQPAKYDFMLGRLNKLSRLKIRFDEVISSIEGRQE